MSVERDIGRREPPRVATRAVVLATAAIIVALMAVAFGLELFFYDRVGMSFVDRHRFPAPGVIPDERAQRLALEAEQNRQLDGADGRMPIEAAMRAIAAKGARAFEPVKTAP
jgi:hypothetical protein